MISVIIPAYNEEKTIEQTLNSLVSQDYKSKFEVIFVDNNSTDNTVKIAKSYTKKLPLKIFHEKTQGRGAAKFCGAKHAKGEILAYLDADSQAFPNWLSVIDQSFKDKETIAITGPWEVHDLPDGFTKWFLHNFQEEAMLPITLYLGHPDLNGMNMAIRKDIYEKSGGFNIHLNVHDDFDLAKRISKFGKVKYIKEMKVLTSGRRYKKGIVPGIMSYHKGSLKYLFGKRADLEDIR